MTRWALAIFYFFSSFSVRRVYTYIYITETRIERELRDVRTLANNEGKKHTSNKTQQTWSRLTIRTVERVHIKSLEHVAVKFILCLEILVTRPSLSRCLHYLWPFSYLFERKNILFADFFSFNLNSVAVQCFQLKWCLKNIHRKKSSILIEKINNTRAIHNKRSFFVVNHIFVKSSRIWAPVESSAFQYRFAVRYTQQNLQNRNYTRKIR